MTNIKQKLFFVALLLAFIVTILHPDGFSAGLVFLAAAVAVISITTRKQTGVLRVTLTVNEILMDVMDAFRVEIPFMINGFSTDFSSQTAVKGDTITAHIATLPTVATYDVNTGFDNGATAADALLTDVPVTMDQFSHVPVKVTWLTQLASKLPLYREAIRNTGYVLAKKVVDYALTKVLAVNFTKTQVLAPINVNLDSLEDIRTQLNINKAANRNRFGICSSQFAAALQNDDRVKSSLFYSQLNGDQGYRHFTNIAGFSNVWEYPDFPTNAQSLSGFFGDRRAIVIANRRVDYSNAAAQLGVPEVMKFYPLSDPMTGLNLTGVAYQKAGTGDVIVSVAILYGIGAGTQGGAANALTDAAGYRTTTA